MTAGVQRLLRVTRNVFDLERAVAFYRGALGFSLVGETRIDDPAWDPLLDAADSRAAAVLLRLGAQELELLAFDRPGQDYPADGRSYDLWFQHLAIVVADMDAAYAQLCRHPFVPITTDGPQRLPPNTGSVTAFKFRDPDGHPLELIHFPPGTGDARWQTTPGLFLGIDHCAIAVADVQRSLDFYTRLLGLKPGGNSLNSGAAQARLDHAPDGVRVDVSALQPQVPGPPHLELLGYERPRGRAFPAGARAHDALADRLVLEVDDLPRLMETLKATDTPLVPARIATLRDGRRAALTRDPTGHWLLLQEPGGVHPWPAPQFHGTPN